MTREEIQRTTTDEITNTYYGEDRIYLAEVGTGGGKSKILLDSAFAIMRRTNKSVIISTYSNQLATQMKEQALSYLNMGISDYDIERIKILAGRNNFVDKDIILSEAFIEEYSKKEDGTIRWDNANEIAKWLTAFDNDRLSSQFINDFNLPASLVHTISMQSESLIDETNIEDSAPRISNAIYQMLDKNNPCVYITNHFYLLLLYRLSAKIDQEVYKLPILLDELHTLNGIGSLFFSNSFSAYRIVTLCNSLIALDETNESQKVLLNSIKNVTKTLFFDVKDVELFRTNLFKMATIFTGNENELVTDEPSIEEIVETTEKEKKKSDKILKRNKYVTFLNAKSKSAQHRELKLGIKKEITELRSIVSTLISKPKIELEINFSPIKEYPTCKVMNENPISALRSKFFGKSKAFIAGVSGTITVSPENRFIDNKWSFERIGLFPYADNFLTKIESVSLIDFVLAWNRRVNHKLVFTVKPSIFKKQQALYKIYKEQRFQYPKYEKARDIDVRKQLESVWIKNLASAVEEDAVGNILVLMTSYDNVALMQKYLSEIQEKSGTFLHDYKIFHSKENEPLSVTQEQYKKCIENRGKAILIAGLNAYTGLDLPGDLINTIVFSKLPFEPDGKRFSGFHYGSFSSVVNNRLRALLTFRQGLGRGLRDVSDKVIFLLFDERIEEKRNIQFLKFLDNMANRVF